MELLDRYLQAVKFWLPRKQNTDIVAELSEDIRSEIEDKEAELRRPLVQAELEAILTRWGHPMMVAERYLPQRSLIGPVLLPAYTLVLTSPAPGHIVPRLLVVLGFAIFDADRRTADFIAGGLVSVWVTAVQSGRGHHRDVRRHGVAPGHVPTGRRGARTSCSNRDRRADPNAIPRSQSIVELVLGLVMVWWWLPLWANPTSYRLAETFRIILWPLYSWLYWPILGYLMCWRGPRVRQPGPPVVDAVSRAGARMAIDTAGPRRRRGDCPGPFFEIATTTPPPAGR